MRYSQPCLTALVPTYLRSRTTRMSTLRPIAFLAPAVLLAVAATAPAETKVELKDTHLCCGACVKAVGTILKDIEGCKGECDAKAKTITITAKDDATAQKAVDALAAAGFHGDTGTSGVKIKN